MGNSQATKLVVEFVFWFVTSGLTLLIIGCPDIIGGLAMSIAAAFVITVLNRILKAVLDNFGGH